MDPVAVPCCAADHPPHQRYWRRWPCPACGAALRRDLVAFRADPDCPLLHSDDQLACAECSFVAYGNLAAKLAATVGHTCPCRDCGAKGCRQGTPCLACGGKGYRTKGTTPARQKKPPPAMAVA